jgi:membrane-associated phospholipid phosphatase
MLKPTAISLFVSLAVFSCAAQDTIVPVKTGRPFIIPAAAVLYGAVSLSLQPLKDVNVFIHRNTVGMHPTRIDDYLQYVPSVAAHALMIAGIRGQHSFSEMLLIDVIAGGTGTAAVFALKRITKEERPDQSDRNSFPSGHTTLAFASAEFLRSEYSKISPWYGIGGYAVAGLTAYFRLYNDAHWFGDVVAGAGIGILTAKATLLILPWVERHIFKKGKHQNVYKLNS